MDKTLILCDCLGSQPIDEAALSTVGGLRCSKVHSALCRGEIDSAARAIAAGNTVVACRQEQATFEDLAAEIDTPAPEFVDLRDRAGWSDEAAAAGPKMAALAADALRAMPQVKSFDVISEGLCLILGAPGPALAAARQLAEHLSVTVLLEPGSDAAPEAGFDLILGHLRGATGALGQFELRIDALREAIPGGRGAPRWTDPRDGARSTCDTILDLRRAPPLFPAHEKRDGYLRADPGRPEAVAEATLAMSHMVGTFEKPLYVALTPELCAHSRAGKPACSRCLDACPTGAISTAGDHVSIDPLICAGCGACSALCPSGAILSDAPAPEALFARMLRLAEAYRAAGGRAPRLLVHGPHGAEMIRLAARFGRGLPADVIPLEQEKVTGFGHAAMLAARASGFVAVDLLLPPDADRAVCGHELALAEALAGPTPSVRLLDLTDPDALSDALFGAQVPAPVPPVLSLGTPRRVARLAAKSLTEGADILPLPEGAPYGAVTVDTQACTLCLACVSLCPSGALGDNPDMPQLRFQEDACLQCGLCANICPEQAIALIPRMDLSDAALRQKVLHEEEPFACISCGTAFGSRAAIERITEKLAGHAMFAGTDKARLIQMCDDCRIQAQYHSQDNPFAGPERRPTRTTDDYLSKRRDH